MTSDLRGPKLALPRLGSCILLTNMRIFRAGLPASPVEHDATGMFSHKEVWTQAAFLFALGRAAVLVTALGSWLRSGHECPARRARGRPLSLQGESGTCAQGLSHWGMRARVESCSFRLRGHLSIPNQVLGNKLLTEHVRAETIESEASGSAWFPMSSCGTSPQSRWASALTLPASSPYVCSCPLPCFAQSQVGLQHIHNLGKRLHQNVSCRVPHEQHHVVLRIAQEIEGLPFRLEASEGAVWGSVLEHGPCHLFLYFCCFLGKRVPCVQKANPGSCLLHHSWQVCSS